MATTNFHYTYASACFAALLGKTDEWDFRDLESNLRHALEEIEPFCFNDRGEDTEELRSYPSTVIGQLYTSKSFGDVHVGASLTVVIRSGYYEGVCFDWLPNFEVSGTEFNNLELSEIESAVSWGSDMSAGLQKIQSKNIMNYLTAVTEQLVAEVEKVFSTFAEQTLNKIGSFSNGEAIYEPIN